MNERTYVSVILPLRLTWNPCYYTEEAGRIVRGSRVRVLFARREYVGVVEAVGVHPSPDILDKVAPVLAVEDLPPVTEAELRLWDFVASYYLCSIGEVYRGAYPSTSVAQEKTAARIRERLSERLGRLEEKLAKAHPYRDRSASSWPGRRFYMMPRRLPTCPRPKAMHSIRSFKHLIMGKLCCWMG